MNKMGLILGFLVLAVFIIGAALEMAGYYGH